MEDSPRPEVLALLDGGALRAGLGCDGAGGVGPTRVWYLLGAGASEEEPTEELPWVAAVANKAAATAAVVGGVAATGGGEVAGGAAAGAAGLEPPAGGGEELRTLIWKACPPRVFTMVGLELERRWRGEFQTGNGDLK